MNGTQTLMIAILVVFTADAVLLSAMILLKTVHRHIVQNQAGRRREYLLMLSRHLASPNHTVPIGRRIAEDPAFLDAVIDLRNAVAGPAVDRLSGILGGSGIVERQSARLRRRFPLGRRLQAAVFLAELGDESSVAILLEHLSDQEPEIRIQCARGLSRMQWTPGIDAIVARLSVETPWVRARFADTLIGFGNKATWPLLAYIRFNHRFETEGPAAAIRTLATIGDIQAGPVLIEILGEAEDPEVQIALVEALGSVGGPHAHTILGERLQSGDWRLRAKAGSALGDIGDPSAIPTLFHSLEDENWWVRRNSASAMARLPGGIPALYAALKIDDAFAKDAAAEALADAGELIAARQRVQDGGGSGQDRLLLSHMHGDITVQA